MAEILVPIIKEEKTYLYKIEANYKTGGTKTIELCNKIKGQGFDGIDCIIDKIIDFLGKEINISIRLRNIETGKILTADCITMNTQSITLGILSKIIEVEENRILKTNYDYIVLTGNYTDGKFVSVDDIEKKLEAVKTINSKKKKRTLFLYVNEQEIVKTGFYDETLQIEHLSYNSNCFDLDNYIFVENFTDEQKTILKNITLDKTNEFIETNLYKNLKFEINSDKNRGYFLVGMSNSGKSVNIYNLCKYLMKTQKIYAPVWITINNSRLQEILKTEHSNFGSEPKSECIELKINKLEQYLITQLNFDLHRRKEKEFALVIDNLELPYCDEILDAVHLLLSEYPNFKYIFITSWSKCDKKEKLDSLQIHQKELSEISIQDFRGILSSVIANQFTTELQLLSEEQKNELTNVLYKELRYTPGEISLTLSALQNISFQTLITKLKDESQKTNEKRNYFLRLQYAKLGLFSQIVLYAYLNLYCKFDEKDSLDSVAISIDDVEKSVRNSEFINKKLITHDSILKALKQIKNSYIFEEVSEEKYIIKSDRIRFLLFALSDEDITKQLLSKFISKMTLINMTILYDWFDEYKNLIKSNNFYTREKALFEVCSNSKSNIKYLEELRKFNVDFDNEDDDDEGWCAIHYAAYYNSSIEVVKYLCEECHINIKKETKDKLNVLHLAAINENPKILEYFISLNCIDINAKSNYNWTPLHYASKYSRNSEILELLISNNANPALKDNLKTYPIHLAASNPEYSIINFFLNNKKYKKQFEVTDDKGKTPLAFAILYNSNFKVIDSLLNAGCNKDFEVNGKENIFHLGLMNSNLDVVQNLFTRISFEQYNYRNSNELFPIAKAIMHNSNIEVIRFLYNKGLDFTVTDELNATLIFNAVMNPNIEIFKYLLSLELYDINDTDSQNDSIVHYAIQFNENEQIVSELRKLKCDFSSINSEGLGTLQLAIKNSNSKILQKLLSYHIYNDINDIIDDNGRTILHFACEEGDLNHLKMLLHAGADITKKTYKNETPLMLAVKNNSKEIVEYLLKETFYSKSDYLEATDDAGRTALCYSIQYSKNTEIIKMLLDYGANTKIEDKKGCNLAHILCQNNYNYEILDYLLRIGVLDLVTINKPDYEGTPPFADALINNENLDILKRLIKEGVKTHIIMNEQGYTALHCACLNPNPDVVQFLLKNRDLFIDDINEEDSFGYNALSRAIYEGEKIEILKYILNAGGLPKITKANENLLHLAIRSYDGEDPNSIDIVKQKINFILENHLCDETRNILDENGDTVLSKAITYIGDIEIFKTLIDYNPEYLNLNTIDNNTIFHIIALKERIELFNYIVSKFEYSDFDYSEMINCKNKFGDIPLFLAVMKNCQLDIIKFLIDKTENIMNTNNMNENILFFAGENENASVLEYLLEEKKLKSNINNVTEEGTSLLLHVARYGNNLEILKKLIDWGADINHCNKDGRTILHMAAINPDVNFVKVVVEDLLYDDIFKSDRTGRTALHYAAIYSNFETFSYLLKLGFDPYHRNENGKTPLDLVEEDREKFKQLVDELFIK